MVVIKFTNHLIVRGKRKYLKSTMKPNWGLGAYLIIVLHKELKCKVEKQAHVQEVGGQATIPNFQSVKNYPGSVHGEVLGS